MPRFLGIILRVLRLEVFFMDFLNHKKEGMVFLSGFPSLSFKVYNTVAEPIETVRGCVSLKK
jgi:hypothetical protein